LKIMPSCVVWTSLLLGPLITLAIGVLFLTLQPLTGGIFVAMGLCGFFCVFVCWRPFIPFTIQVANTLGHVMSEIPGTVGVAALGGFLSLVWSCLAFLAMTVGFAGVELPREAGYGVVFVVCWGIMVASYYTHTAICGIYARWYHGKDSGSEVCASIKTANTALGSICYGAFIVALIRTIEFALRQAKSEAAGDDNFVAVIAFAVLECWVRCLGDIVEYMSEWVYVQVALRGTSFCDSARVCFAMCSWSNFQFILSDLLVDSIGTLAALMCCGAGVGGGMLGNIQNASEKNGLLVGALLGLIPGVMIGSVAASIITAGTKTILSCWVEDPEQLARKRPDLHQKFHETMVIKFQDNKDYQQS